MDPSVKIFSGNGSHELAGRIAQRFGAALGKINIQKFSDGEFQPIFLESIRGDYVFLVQSTFAPADLAPSMPFTMFGKEKPQAVGQPSSAFIMTIVAS